MSGGVWHRFKHLCARAWASRPAKPESQPWGTAQPSPVFLLEFLLLLSVVSLLVTVSLKRLRDPAKFLESCGVSVRKVQRTMKEIDRKTFHLCTLLVPLIHQVLLQSGWSNDECVQLCVGITVAGWTADCTRVYGPEWVRRNWPMQQLLRAKEQQQLTGACFLALGCTLTMAISPPSITMASLLFLVLGDLSAAIVGVSFGKETVSLKLGREGKKSAEGSAAMLAICFVVGCTVFAGIELREYAVALGAIVATLTELVEPFGLNDNLTIPLFSSVALQYGFSRIATCQVGVGGGVALLKDIYARIDGR